MKRLAIGGVLAALFVPAAAHAIGISAGPTLAGSPVTSETNPLTNGVTVSMTVDGTTDHVEVDFFQVSPVDSSLTQVASITQAVSGNSSPNIFWNALWLIGTDLARHDGTFAYQVTPSGSGTAGTPAPSTPGTFMITSVDIHNLTVTPSLDTNQQPTFPYVISYALAKAARVTVTISNSSSTVIATVISSKPQPDETISTNTVTWNGLNTSGTAAPIGNYTVTVNATDLTNGDPAITRTRSFSVLSLAGNQDPQKLFESGVFVFPNPVRNGQGTFQMGAVRDGATLSLKIYTITGTLVFQQTFPGVTTGTSIQFNWDAANQSKNRVGRGLYYYVVREDDATGTLQTIKKMAVIP